MSDLLISGNVYTTTRFGDRFGQHQGVVRNILVKIDLVTPSARTIRLSDGEVDTKDGVVWEPLITDAGAIEALAQLGGTGPDPCTFSFSVMRRKLAYQATATDSILNTFASHEWEGAAATVYLWCDGLSGFIDAHPGLAVARVSSFRATPDGAEITIKQDTSPLNNEVKDAIITLDAYPGAPNGSINQMAPIIIGNRRAEGLRFKSPFESPYADGTTRLRLRDKIGGGTLVDGGVMVDSGRSSGKVVVIFAGHALSKFGDKDNGANLFIRGEDTLGEVEQTGLTLVNDVGGAKMTIDTAALQARIGVVPVDRRHDVSQVIDAMNAADVFETGSYATLDGATADANIRTIQLLMPSPSALGNYYGLPYMAGGGQAVFLCCAYSTKAGSSGVSLHGRATGTLGLIDSPVSVAPASTGLDDVKVVEYFYHQDADDVGVGGDNDDWYSPIERWNFGGGADVAHETIWLCASVPNNAANYARIFWIGLVVKYSPSLVIVNPGSRGRAVGGFDLQGRRTRKGSEPLTGTTRFGGKRETVGKVEEIQSDFFMNSFGAMDDSSGTYTGTPSQEIERVPDVVHWLLRRYGGLGPDDIELEVDSFGSLKKARSLVTSIEGRTLTVARSVTEKPKLVELLGELADETSCYWFINRFTGRHNWIRWDQGPSTSYPRTLEADDVLDKRFEIENTPESDVRNASEVLYGWDAFRNKNLHRVFVAKDRSGSGFAEGNLRDQYLTIVSGKNDRLDFQTEEGVKVASLTPGDYTGVTMAQHVRAQCAAVSTAFYWKVEYGFEVILDYNDTLPILIGATPYAIILTPGSYVNGRLLAEHVQAAITAAIPGFTWLVTYDTTSLLFTIAGSTSFVLDWAVSTPIQQEGCSALLGYNWGGPTSSLASHQGTYARAAETFFVIRKQDTLTILSSTGTNFARSAWPTLGYSDLYNRPAKGESVVVQRGFVALARRGIRERTSNASRLLHGERPDQTVDSRWLSSTEAAKTKRDVDFDWRVEKPMRIKFSTLRMPDIERGMVFPTGDSLDGLIPYTKRDTTSTSWAGRRWMVLECRQNCGGGGRGWDQEIVAVEVRKLAFDSSAVPITEDFDMVELHSTATQSGSPSSGILYAQKIRSDGSLLWGAGGTRIDHAVSAAYYPACLYMPDGGFIGAWAERQAGVVVKIIVNRFDSNLTPLWGTTGVVAWSSTTNAGPQARSGVAIISDGLDGCIVGWTDQRDAANRVSVQRFNGLGVAQWTADGVRLTTGASSASNDSDAFLRMHLLPDGSGFYVLWVRDESNALTYAGSLFGQKLGMDGSIKWAAGGKDFGGSPLAFFSGGGTPSFVPPRMTMLSDGLLASAATSGGTSITARKYDVDGNQVWESSNLATLVGGTVESGPVSLMAGADADVFVVWSQQSGAGVHNLQIHRVLSDGSLPFTNPVLIDAMTEGGTSAALTTLASDLQGGVWGVYRSLVTGNPFYVFRFRADGVIPWPKVALGFGLSSDPSPKIAADSSGDAYIAWGYTSGGVAKQVAQRIAADGTLVFSEATIRTATTVSGGNAVIDTLAAVSIYSAA